MTNILALVWGLILGTFLALVLYSTAFAITCITYPPACDGCQTVTICF